jgi:hypothetical protein
MSDYAKLSEIDVLRMEQAEYEALTPSELSKRHIRILCALFQVALQEKNYTPETLYSPVSVIIILTESLFGKKHTANDVQYFTRDLVIRGYVASLQEQLDIDTTEEDCYAITSKGVELLEWVKKEREELFISQTRNSTKNTH